MGQCSNFWLPRLIFIVFELGINDVRGFYKNLWLHSFKLVSKNIRQTMKDLLTSLSLSLSLCFQNQIWYCSGVRRRVRARTGAGGLPSSLFLFCFAVASWSFLSPSIYLQIWASLCSGRFLRARGDKILAASWLFWLCGEAVVRWSEVMVGSLGSGWPDFLCYGFPVFAVRVGEIWLVRPYILSEDLFRLVRWSGGSSEWCFGYGGAVSLHFFSGSRWAPVDFATTEAAVEFSYAGWWWYLAQLVRDSAVRGSKGVVYGIWMVPLGASSPQSSSARPSSVLTRMKADAFVWSCASVLSCCSVSVWRQRWFFQLRVLFPSVLEGFRWCGGSRLQLLVATVTHLVMLTSQHYIRSLELVRWCSISALCRSWGFGLVLGSGYIPAFLDGFSSRGCSISNKCSVRRCGCLTSGVATDYDGGRFDVYRELFLVRSYL